MIIPDTFMPVFVGVASIGLVGAGIQDAFRNEVYDFWWIPSYIGAFGLFLISFVPIPLYEALIAVVFSLTAIPVGALVVKKHVPAADGLGVIALALGLGLNTPLAFLIFGVAAGIAVVVTRKRELPWIPFIAIGFVVASLLH